MEIVSIILAVWAASATWAAVRAIRSKSELAVVKASLESDLNNLRTIAEEQGQWAERSTAEFKALSAEILEQQRQSFMNTANQTLEEREKAVEQMVKPLAERIDALDRARTESTVSLKDHVEALTGETRSLSAALSRPHVRGAWGEVQVERVLELSGLKRDYHYTVQDVAPNGGRTDFRVLMPDNRHIILDSKVALSAIQEAVVAQTDDEREEKLNRHVAQMRSHVTELAGKEYSSGDPDSPDFVVMVVPEFALIPAVEREPTIIEKSLEKRVVIVTYPALLALLKCVVMSWQERTITEEAHNIGQLGKELYDRLVTFAGHLENVGKGLDGAIRHYNSTIGSIERSVLPQARKFSDFGIDSVKKMPDLNQIERSARLLQSADLEPTEESEEGK